MSQVCSVGLFAISASVTLADPKELGARTAESKICSALLSVTVVADQWEGLCVYFYFFIVVEYIFPCFIVKETQSCWQFVGSLHKIVLFLCNFVVGIA